MRERFHPAHRPRTLLVEDHDAVAEVLSAVLATLGVPLRRAVTLAEAVAILRDEPVGVLLTDHNLPDGRGVELLLGLGADRPRYAILMSAIMDAGLAAEGYANGYDLCLHKSQLTPQRLADEVLRGGRGRMMAQEREAAE